jgi:hypothetical protein
MRNGLCRAGGLHAREWDGEYVIYSDRSDQTHLITGVAARVFARLDERPSDSGTLAAASGAAADEIDSALDHLIELGIAETRS